MIDDKQFEVFMLAVHEHGTSGLGYRKALEAYEQSKQPSEGVDEVSVLLRQLVITDDKEQRERFAAIIAPLLRTKQPERDSMECEDAWEALRLLWWFLPENEPCNPHSKKAIDIERNKRWHRACEIYQKYAGRIPTPPTASNKEGA